MIGLPFVHLVMGLVFATVALVAARDGAGTRRWIAAAFWGLVAANFLLGDRLGDLGNGVLLVLLAGLAAAGLGRPGGPATAPGTRQALAARLKERLFIPALAVPLVTLAGSFALAHATLGGHPLVDPKQTTLVSLTLGVLVGLGLCFALLKAPLRAPAEEGGRLFGQVGWAAVLPQALAALGAVFALAGVGTAVGGLVSRVLPADNALAAVCAYTVGMALLTVVMGNAFAAFPVMTAGVGLPLIVHRFGGDPAAMGALGMLSGFCGTLVTPMAANFNVVPTALLDLKDRHAVIKAQAPTALILLCANTVLLYLFAFRR